VISDETDRVYLKAPKKVEVEDRGNDRVSRCGLRDSRMPSSGIRGPRRLRVHRAGHGRLHEDGLREAAQIGSPVELKPGASWGGSQLWRSRVSADIRPVGIQVAMRQVRSLFRSGKGRVCSSCKRALCDAHLYGSFREDEGALLE